MDLESAPARVERALTVNPVTAAVYRASWDVQNPNIRFVFLATTGRSGSFFICELLRDIPGIWADHEPDPIMHGDVMIARQQGRVGPAARLYWRRKAINLRRASRGHSVYAECNHMFVKTYWREALADFGSRLSVLHLRRASHEVAASLLRLGVVPGTPIGNRWTLDWRAPANVLRMEDLLEEGGQFDAEFFRCLWYWHEVEARIASRLVPALDGDRLVLLDWTTRFDPLEVEVSLAKLGIRGDSQDVAARCTRKVNARIGVSQSAGTAQPSHVSMSVDFAAAVAERSVGL